MKQTTLEDFEEFKAIVQKWLNQLNKYHAYLLKNRTNKRFRQLTLNNCQKQKRREKHE